MNRADHRKLQIPDLLTGTRSAFEEALQEHRNQAFNVQNVQAGFNCLMRDYSIQCSGGDLSISNQDISDLEFSRDNVIELLSDRFAKLIEMARARQKNLLKYQEINVISLGLDCLSRTICSRWGLKKSRRLGELSGPFDLSVHPPHCIELLIKDGFPGYLDIVNLKFSEEHNFCSNSLLGINFNHEVGIEYASDDFLKLRNIYSARILNFQKCVIDNLPLMLVVHVPHFTGLSSEIIASFIRILDYIKGLRGNSARTAMIVVNTFQDSSRQVVDEIVEQNFCLYNVALPASDYVWFEPNCFLSDSGYSWESSIADLISSRIDKLLE